MPFIAGRNAVLEALRAGQRVERILIDAATRPSDAAVAAVVELAGERHITVAKVARSRLDTIDPRHQGVAAEVRPFGYTPFAELLAEVRSAGQDALVLALDAVQDPQNLGTLLRTALAVRVTGVLIPERRAVGVTPAVVRASAGAAEHMRIAQVPNLVRGLDALKEAGTWVVGLDVRSGTAYDETDLKGALTLVVGSEGSGISRLVREHCDLLVTLPMAGPTESLNAAVAGSIVLYQVYRNRLRGR
ncbi:MAG: rRNA (guanosine2251-2-O)-methyltransferase [Chloroflexota bacterium]|jgi:23S rRNA (guanosine2251-2'-O)-methyltransferase|nr:rRNA (guanosine2251-2-O)-methyltransferase [Chloroflexota bacterium]